jgi:SpoVK/Ycf46/Vps4 family AAA+-type ATPase
MDIVTSTVTFGSCTQNQMARADLLVTLVRAAASGDRTLLRQTVEALAAEERGKRHVALADRLQRALNQAQPAPAAVHLNPTPQPSGKDFLLETEPTKTFEQLILADEVRDQLSELVEEQQRADLLRSYGANPRHTILLSGPPGNGKTSVAECIANSLGLPFFTVRYDALIGTYLGETNQRMRRLFDYVRITPCVLFFDEFDAVGKERGDTQETGEIKRLVATLLLQMDALPSYAVVIAATNHQELLDRAVWRRFEIRIKLDPPTNEELVEFLRKRIGLDLRENKGIETAVRELELSSYAEAENFAADIARRLILGLGRVHPEEVIRSRIDQWSSRLRAPYGRGQGQASVDFRSPITGSEKIRRAP